MNYYIYVVSLLCSLERYLPYMSEEDLLRILDGGERPDAFMISVWELKREERERQLERVFREAYARQK